MYSLHCWVLSSSLFLRQVSLCVLGWLESLHFSLCFLKARIIAVCHHTRLIFFCLCYIFFCFILISFYYVWGYFVFSFLGPWSASLNCSFEIFLFFFCRCSLLYTIFLWLILLYPTCFGILCFHLFWGHVQVFLLISAVTPCSFSYFPCTFVIPRFCLYISSSISLC